MKNICNYTIIQRDADGFGRGTFAGTLSEKQDGFVFVRVMREDDNAMVVPWQKCDFNGTEWTVQLTIPEGGLYRIEARFTATEEHPCNNKYDWSKLVGCAYHVGVGDVFIMAGQSNMSGYGKDPAYDPPQLGVHLYDNSGNWVLATHPVNSVPNPIYPNNDDSSGTSPALAFGRMMAKRLGVPIGLVAAARGGSSLEDWNPAEDDCFLYNSLVAKMEQVGKFTGMLWYQGCNETCEKEEAETYYEKFEQSLSLWREKFGHFPIVVCQINRHAWNLEDRERYWGMVREAQRQAGLKLRDVYVIPTMDMPTVDGIHNSSGSCIVIGERIANAMLKGHYKMSGFTSPNIEKISRVDNRTILLTFRDAHMLRTMDDSAVGMNIEDENGMMDCVKVTVCEQGAKVTAERDIGNIAVFHAYWKREEPAFFLRDIYSTPMLACYGVPIED